MNEKLNNQIEEVVDKLKDLIKEGNVKKVAVTKGDETYVSIPLNLGLIGGLAGLAVAPLITIAAAVVTLGTGCKIELISDDGTKTIVDGEKLTGKVKDTLNSEADDDTGPTDENDENTEG